ncbi:MAG: hypothetical protein K2X27_26665, partial [Candidatus Obscuribacterales bacterium]|nr:hypothetical protein [Candidatus Obscuribacterales bacterium]
FLSAFELALLNRFLPTSFFLLEQLIMDNAKRIDCAHQNLIKPLFQDLKSWILLSFKLPIA